MNFTNKAQKQNPVLESLGVLVGEWDAVGSHPYIPGKVLHGRVVCEWIEGGAFLIMRTEIDEPKIPNGISIFGSDDIARELFILYFDERGVSRKYDVSFKNNVMTLSRMSPEFSQRMVLTITDGGNTIMSKGEMSEKGGAWEPDLELTYTRKI